MANPQFPRTMVGGVSVSRMIMGTNWMFGYSHTSSSADAQIRNRNANRQAFCDMTSTFLQYGVDTTMGPFHEMAYAIDGIHDAEQKMGKKVIIVDTPILNVDDSPAARKEAEVVIKRSASQGATFCFPHHSSAEQLVNKNKQTIDRLPDYLQMIRDNGMIPGLSAHMPELIIYSDLNEYDVQTYIQLYNCMGFLMQVEIEYIHKVIWSAKKPVMSIKPMAAGRCSPFVGITFSFATLRECDMVTVGCLSPEEALEDIEIGFAAIERRQPDLEGRSSPNKTVIMQE